MIRLILYIALIFLYSTVSFAIAKQEKDPFRQLHEDAMLFHNNMSKQMDAMFREQERYMQKLRANLYSSNIFYTTQEGCAYKFNIKGYDKSDIKIAFKNQILSVSGEKTSSEKTSQQADNFLYSFSIPKNCTGNPDIVFKKEDLTIVFKEGE